MGFWLISGALTLVTVLLLLRPLLRGRGMARARAAYDLDIYRDQLREIESDLARGVVTEAEAETSRAEISRRLLAAAAEAERAEAAGPAPVAATRFAVAAVALLMIGGGYGVYSAIGAPDQPDLPRAARLAELDAAWAARPDQAAAEAEMAGRPSPGTPPEDDPRLAEYRALVDQVAAIVAERPNDRDGHRLLASALARLGRLEEARAALDRAIVLAGPEVTGAELATRAELMIQAAGGYVSPEAEAAIEEALSVDPEEPAARYYQGLAMAQAQRPDRAYAIWLALYRDSGPDAPWLPALRRDLPSVAAAISMPLPDDITTAATRPGPSAADIAAAEAMTVEERAAMVRSMVERRASKLAEVGGPPVEWAELIRALGVLEERGRASAIWREAQEVFAGDPGALALLRAAAREAEVAN
ncbi:MAG: c-type cytochrome biogenesis protein CcmI [Pseudomonadota bacterium]